MTDEEREWLRRLGFEQSPYTTTRWAKNVPDPDAPGRTYLKAWIDLGPKGWRMSTWDLGEPTSQQRDTLGLGLVPMLAFAIAEGWL